jgi:SAM-dependent methyltransferase
MNRVRDHYERLLAAHYTWMLGDFDAAVQREQARLRSAGVGSARAGQVALDLGAGSGVHSVALAKLGYEVVAVDLSLSLLNELAARRGALPIRCLEADLTALPSGVPHDAAVVTCMGDTLLHLPSKDAVGDVLRAAHGRLSSGGRFVASFRDLTTELRGTERFLEVRSSNDRILTCFLEYGPDRVTVHDLLHLRDADGWQLRKGAYDKLRLAPGWVEQALRGAGLSEATVVADGHLQVATALRR